MYIYMYSSSYTMYDMCVTIRQSTMVFSEHTGLTNLYSMLRYCLNETKCRRALIARHFGETWKDSDCQGLCDVCQSIKGVPGSITTFTNSSNATQEDVTVIAQGFLEAIDKNHVTEKKLTAMKLVETWKATDAAKSLSSSKNKPDAEKLEKALMHSLLDNVLKEDFHFTSYTTICYITAGRRAGLVRGNKVKVTMEMTKKKVKPTYPNMSSVPATSSDMVAKTSHTSPMKLSPSPEVHIAEDDQSHCTDSFMVDTGDESRPSTSSAMLPTTVYTSREPDGDSSMCSHSLVDSLASEDDQSDVAPGCSKVKRRLPPTIFDDDDDDFVATKKLKSTNTTGSKGKLWLSSKRRKSKEKPGLQIVQQPTLTHSDHDNVIEIDSD